MHHDGTTAQPLDQDQDPGRRKRRKLDDPPRASRHQIIGRCGLGSAVAAGVGFAVTGALAAGLFTEHDRESWAWARATLVTFMVIGLVVAGFGYGVDGANRRGERISEAIELSATSVRHDVADSTRELRADHRALHIENVDLTDLVGANAEELALLRKENAEMSALLGQISLDLSEDRLDGIVVTAVRKAYTLGYTDAMDGRPPQAPPDNVRRLPGV